MKILTVAMALALAVCGALALSAQAAYLDFEIQPPHPLTASISYVGGNAPLVVFDLHVSDVIGVGLPGGTLPIVGGDLDFTTGPFSGFTATQWFFGGGPGSFITLTGAIPAIGINNPIVLLTGWFGTATVIDFGPNNNFMITGAAFQDYKACPLLDYYFPQGAPPAFNGTLNVSFSAQGPPPGAFATASSLDIGAGNLINTPVPVPASLLLMGSGLLGLAGFGLRRRKP